MRSLGAGHVSLGSLVLLRYLPGTFKSRMVLGGKLYLIGQDLALLYLSERILPYSIYQTGLCLMDSSRWCKIDKCIAWQWAMTSLQGSTLPYLYYIPSYVKLTNLWLYIVFHFLLMYYTLKSSSVSEELKLHQLRCQSPQGNNSETEGM